MVGWRGKRVNTLRLWTACALDPIKLDAFNAGDHVGALVDVLRADALVRVLYPADSSAAGQELRLRQEYFFTSASIQDIVRRHAQYVGDVRTLPDKAAIQLNDTHPAIAVAELMRLLIDDHGLEFVEAWDVTRRTFGYTNHTLLPEALESWPLPLFERLFPRHMQIVYKINSSVLKQARGRRLSDAEVSAISLIDEGGDRRIRMANLAFAGSHSVNGVAALHTELMKIDGVCRSAQALSRQDQQQDQRRDAAALAAAMQSRPDRRSFGKRSAMPFWTMPCSCRR